MKKTVRELRALWSFVYAGLRADGIRGVFAVLFSFFIVRGVANSDVTENEWPPRKLR